MKPALFSIAIIFLSTVASAQDWELSLSNGETYVNVQIVELRNDSVQIVTPEWTEWLWLANIERLQRKGSAWKSGAWIGIGIGFTAGALYAIGNPEKTVELPTAVRSAITGVVGAIPGGLIGAFVGGFIDAGERYEFARMTPDERTAVVRDIILD
jgi:hypothetical protein